MSGTLLTLHLDDYTDTQRAYLYLHFDLFPVLTMLSLRSHPHHFVYGAAVKKCPKMVSY